MSRLEEVILGYLKERTVDRQLSDAPDQVFHMVNTRLVNRFIECIKHEWTSKQNDQDSGIRSEEESRLIQQHMARSTYWPSQWHETKNMRSGEYIRKHALYGDKDPLASVELNKLKIQVELPDHEAAAMAAPVILVLPMANGDCGGCPIQ